MTSQEMGQFDDAFIQIWRDEGNPDATAARKIEGNAFYATWTEQCVYSAFTGLSGTQRSVPSLSKALYASAYCVRFALIQCVSF